MHRMHRKPGTQVAAGTLANPNFKVLRVLKSMTAFARHAEALALPHAAQAGEPVSHSGSMQLTWELRTVNHRFFEAVLRLPEACRDLEGPLRDLARAQLARGRLDASLRIQEYAAAKPHIDRQAVDALLTALRDLQQLQPQLSTPTALEVLRWPGVLSEPRPDGAALLRAAEQGFRTALATLQEVRAREGEALQRTLQDRIAQITQIATELRAESAALPRQLEARLQSRLQELGAGVDPQRLAQEIALLAQRADTAEELDRLDAHLLEFQRSFKRGEPVGRHLDFLAQELNREANTLASKAGSSAIAQRGVELKVLIEQIREQVQNVE